MHCWAEIEVQEWLKGSGPDKLCVVSMFDPYGITEEDAKSLKFCEFEEDESYAIFGGVSSQELSFPPYCYFYTASGNASNKWICVPNTRITKENEIILIEQIKIVIKKKNDARLQK